MAPRLRALTEAECYARLYGRDGEASVSVLEGQERERPRAAVGLSGEELRQRFEERLELREPEAA